MESQEFATLGLQVCQLGLGLPGEGCAEEED